MRRRFLVLPLCWLALTAPGGSRALAQGGADMLVSTASEWGGQGGAYTCQQWRAYVTKLYRVADPKGRGYFGAKDFERIKMASSVFAQASFDFFDQSGKGRVTQKEFIEAESPFFALFDKKKNCHVTMEDIRQATAAKPATPAEDKGGRGPGGFGSRNR
ncbi:MAG TPA: hypothetical protein VK446_12990 [Methylocystis sp.]|nr:hypothetical protein [Methylocystis sp.]